PQSEVDIQLKLNPFPQLTPNIHNSNESNDKTSSSYKMDNNFEANKSVVSLSDDSTKLDLDYELDLSLSSCEELYEIPMEDLLSSPSWKQIVEQNSFLWP
ncbi:unnamed protein product, partial [Oppiella nova]